MSTITTINSTDLITNSRAVINTNFSNLNTDKMETSVLDTDTSLAADSDSKVATQKATKAYVDSRTSGVTNVSAGTISKDISSTTTTTIAHGLGSSPSIVRLTGTLAQGSTTTTSSFAYSIYVGSTQYSTSFSVFDNKSSDGESSNTQTFKIVGDPNTGHYTVGTITVDATNITITWAKTGTPTGTAYLVWEANK